MRGSRGLPLEEVYTCTDQRAESIYTLCRLKPMSNRTAELKLKTITNHHMGLERYNGWAAQSPAAVKKPRL